MRISDWSSDVCSSDLPGSLEQTRQGQQGYAEGGLLPDPWRQCQSPETGDIRVVLTFYPPDRRQRDRDNLLSNRTAERRVGKECVRSGDLGCRRSLKNKQDNEIPSHEEQKTDTK